MSEIILYTTADGKANIKLYADNSTVWLTQAQIAELFARDRSVITKHINNILNEHELDEKSNVQIMHIANSDKPVSFYSLDMILAVGFRVRSLRGTQFRKWANTTLKEYLTKGFVLDSDRLKNPDGRPDYFDELLAQIRDIRASESAFTRNCVICLPYQPTTAPQMQIHVTFLHKRKTNCFLLLLAIPLPKL